MSKVSISRFAITGVAGYIAPRHLKAIKDTGNVLVAALDPHDAVGVLDQYFPEADFFTEPERFDRHIEKLKRSGEGKIDYLSICSPNYLHDAHIRMALRTGAHAICEKPLVLYPKNLDLLKEIEAETGKRIYNVLQLRLHPAIKKLKESIDNRGKNIEQRTKNIPGSTSETSSLKPQTSNFSPLTSNINLEYITSRGNWYDYSWKGNMERSGGIAANIGIHFFDMLIWIFGKVIDSKLISSNPRTMNGILKLERAEVNWKLSIDANELPKEIVAKGQRTFRSIKIDGEELEFSEGFTDLHTEVYKDILAGGGYRIEDARPAIELVHSLR